MVAIVMTASGQVKGKARQFGRYRRVAVVDIDYQMHNWGEVPKMISTRAKGVIRILRDFGSCSEGKTERCEYARAKTVAEQMARDYNNRQDWAEGEMLITGGSA